MAVTRLCLSVFLMSCKLGVLVTAQSQAVQFNQVLNVNGDMTLNSFQFPDNSKIETFSQKQQQIIVNQNPNPLSANHVVGSSGQPFVQLSPNSMTIQTNQATDLVGAQIEMAIDPNVLSQMGVTADNTFVAQLSSDRQAWVIMEGIKTVNTTDSTVRMIKLNTIDGEYMAVGRQTVETGSVLTTFNQGQTVNVAGSGIQEVEYTDGFRMSIRASQPMVVKTDIKNGISSSMVTGNIMSVNNYRYLVTSNLAGVQSNLNQMAAVMQLPLNAQRLMTMAQAMGAQPNGAISLGVAQRVVLQNPGGSTTLSPAQKREDTEATTDATEPDTQEAAASSTTKAAAKASSSRAAKSAGTAKSSSAAAAAKTSAAAADDTAASTAEADSASSTSASSAGSSTGDATAAATSVDQSASSSTSATNGSTSTSTSQQQQQAAAATPTQPQASIPQATQLLLAPTFAPIAAQPILDVQNGRIAVAVNQIDGEYIVTMAMAGAAGTLAVTPGALGASPGQEGTPSPQQAGQAGQAGQPAGATTLSEAPANATAEKRQAAEATTPTGNIVMTMTQLSEMVQLQKSGGVMPVWNMMNAIMPQQAGPKLSPFVAKARAPIKDRRAARDYN